MSILALLVVIFLFYVGVGAFSEGKKQKQKRQDENDKLQKEVSSLMAENEKLESVIQPQKKW